jgi:chromosome segregation ATPase
MNFIRILLVSQGFLKGMIFYLGFRKAHEQVVAKNDVLRRELEESKVKIRELESRVEASQTMYECMREGHGIAYGKFVSAREEASHLNTKLSDATNELVECRDKVEALSQSILIMKTKFCKAKEKLQEYRTKAQSFYR